MTEDSSKEKGSQTDATANMSPDSAFQWYPVLTRLFGKQEASSKVASQIQFQERIAVNMSATMKRNLEHLRGDFAAFYDKMKKEGRLTLERHISPASNNLLFLILESVLLFCIGLAIFVFLGQQRRTFWYDTGLVLMVLGGINFSWCCYQTARLFAKDGNESSSQSDDLFYRIFHYGYSSALWASFSRNTGVGGPRGTANGG